MQLLGRHSALVGVAILFKFNKFAGGVALASLILIWGTTWAAIRVGLRGIPPFTGFFTKDKIIGNAGNDTISGGAGCCTGGGSSVAYAASKGALNTMTQSLARALAPLIRVNTVCPGYIDTPWFTKGRGEAGAKDAGKMRSARVARATYSSTVRGERKRRSEISRLESASPISAWPRLLGCQGSRHPPVSGKRSVSTSRPSKARSASATPASTP